MFDDALRPSPEAEAVLRLAGWTPERQVDASEWIQRLREDGNTVFPLAEAIMRNYGGIRLEHQARGGRSVQNLAIEPTLWWGERESVAFVEEVVGARACPLGEASGTAMLAVCEDGRIVLEFEGSIRLIGQDWRAALDRLIFRRGPSVLLADDDVPLDPPRA